MTDQKKREKVIALLERYVDIPNLAGVENYGAKIVDIPAPLITDALALLKAQEPVEPIRLEGKRGWFFYCPSCKIILNDVAKPKHCSECGKAVKWK